MKTKHGILALTVLLTAAILIGGLAACGGGAAAGSGDPLVISGTLSSSGGFDAMSMPISGMSSGLAFAPLADPPTTTSQTFFAAVGSDNTITGKLEDGAVVYNLTGLYDPATRGFSVQARSSSIIFSLAGVLAASGTIDLSKSHAAIQVKDGTEWKTITCSITSSDQTVSGSVTATGGASIPAVCQGKWTFDYLGLEYIVTENSITMYDYNMLPAAPQKYVQDLTVVDVTGTGPWTLLVRGKYYGIGTENAGVPYTGKFYVSTSFDSTLNTAIGTAPVSDILFGIGGPTQLSAAIPAGATLLVAPYVSNTAADVDKENDSAYLYPATDYSPLFIGASATTNAKNATTLKAISGFTLALMH
jgi:phage baseplate assembly protein gpV